MIVGSIPTTPAIILRWLSYEKESRRNDNGAGVLCVTNSGQKYQISQNVERKKFTLWQVVNKGFIKIKTANSPVDLYDLVPWEK